MTIAFRGQAAPARETTRGISLPILAAALALAITPAASYAADRPALKGDGPSSTVKLPAKELGPEKFDELDNSAETEALSGIVRPTAVTHGACILPFAKVKYPIVLNGKGTFRFATTPSRPFDVVMTIDFPGLHQKVDRYYAGSVEKYGIIKNFTAKVTGKVTISGAGNSYGCFVLKITP